MENFTLLLWTRTEGQMYYHNPWCSITVGHDQKKYGYPGKIHKRKDTKGSIILPHYTIYWITFQREISNIEKQNVYTDINRLAFFDCLYLIFHIGKIWKHQIHWIHSVNRNVSFYHLSAVLASSLQTIVI